MEHYRSTLVTTALAVFGLVTAAHVLHPGNYEAQPRGRRVAAAMTAQAASAPTTWTDPPSRLRGIEPAAFSADGTRVLAPRLTVALPPNALTVPRLPSKFVTPASVERKAKADPLGDLIGRLDSEHTG